MGCLASKPASPESTFLRRISVEHFGVLGKRSVGPGFGTEEAAGPEPDKKTMIVDPCSARFVRDPNLHPGDAGGAAGAIYSFIGIKGDVGFPPDVVANIEKEGDVAYHMYGYPTSKHVLHCVGYDFRSYARRELGDLALSAERGGTTVLFDVRPSAAKNRPRGESSPRAGRSSKTEPNRAETRPRAEVLLS